MLDLGLTDCFGLNFGATSLKYPGIGHNTIGDFFGSLQILLLPTF